MNITSASKSGIETYDSCNFLYFLQYILKKPSPSGKSATLGQIVHKVMEILGRRKKFKKHKKISILNNPIHLLDVAFNSFKDKEGHIEFKDCDYRTCKKCLEWLLNNGYHPFNQNVIDTERNFEVSIEKPGFNYEFSDYKTNKLITGFFKIRGIIDLVVQKNKDTINIIDYKTGKYISDWATGKEKDEEAFKKDLQLRMYYLAARLLYPNYKNYEFTVVYCQLGKVFNVEFGEDDYLVILDNIRRHFKKILNNQDPVRLKDDPGRRNLHWKCRNLCHYGISGECDQTYEIMNEHGLIATAKMLQPTISAVSKSKRITFSNTGVIK